MQSARRTGLIAQVTDQIRGEITSGRWKVGSRIPTEPNLAELTRTGRNTVREAVQALVHAGMLERRQGSGTYVVSDSDLGGALTRSLKAAQARDLLELRQALDITAAQLAAARRDEDDIDMLIALRDERERLIAVGDLRAVAVADAELHRGVVYASHNALYLEFYESLMPMIVDDIHDDLSRDPTNPYTDEHFALVDAIIAGDGTGAAGTARTFLDAVGRARH